MILCALRIIIEGYPKVITLNVKTGLITGSFLNIQIYSDPMNQRLILQFYGNNICAIILFPQI